MNTIQTLFTLPLVVYATDPTGGTYIAEARNVYTKNGRAIIRYAEDKEQLLSNRWVVAAWIPNIMPRCRIAGDGSWYGVAEWPMYDETSGKLVTNEFYYGIYPVKVGDSVQPVFSVEAMNVCSSHVGDVVVKHTWPTDKAYYERFKLPTWHIRDDNRNNTYLDPISGVTLDDSTAPSNTSTAVIY